MQRSNRELWFAFYTILIITFIYIFVVLTTGSIPAASAFFGHSLGILGFVLMLMTEILYSMRKRSRSARWGRMSSWLQFHIFTGIVGPYLVLLHTSWKFNGLAGIVMLLTAIIVFSGFVGRYIYTSVPRTVDGVEIEAEALGTQIKDIENDLQQWIEQLPEAERARFLRALQAQLLPRNKLFLVFGRGFQDWVFRQQWRRKLREADSIFLKQAKQLENLFKRRRILERQMQSLATARRMLALWHVVHVPIGTALFVTAFIHVGAAIYYATLLK